MPAERSKSLQIPIRRLFLSACLLLGACARLAQGSCKAPRKARLHRCRESHRTQYCQSVPLAPPSALPPRPRSVVVYLPLSGLFCHVGCHFTYSSHASRALSARPPSSRSSLVPVPRASVPVRACLPFAFRFVVGKHSLHTSPHFAFARSQTFVCARLFSRCTTGSLGVMSG